GNITSAHDCFEFDNPHDAWLIASAPDLLQALQNMLPRFEAMAENLPAEQANDAYNTISFAQFAIGRALRE
ncbi:hypothetical protein, partial [Methylotenera sp.]|uniref:hypothetical protein n=1 Tax=Methylotenera sp. TaxID=2051956 RepID=UPI002487C7D0